MWCSSCQVRLLLLVLLQCNHNLLQELLFHSTTSSKFKLPKVSSFWTLYQYLLFAVALPALSRTIDFLNAIWLSTGEWYPILDPVFETILDKQVGSFLWNHLMQLTILPYYWPYLLLLRRRSCSHPALFANLHQLFAYLNHQLLLLLDWRFPCSLKNFHRLPCEVQ